MIVIDWFYIVHGLKKWASREDGVAAMEAAMLFPPMLALLFGVFDIGNGIILSERTINSSQIAVDLVTRNKTVSAASVADIIAGAKLSYDPYGLSSFGIDIVSVEFDAAKKPVVLWRQTESMLPNNDAVNSTIGLGTEGEGMVIVTVQYTYVPKFAQYFLGSGLALREVAFGRGRRSATVTWDS